MPGIIARCRSLALPQSTRALAPTIARHSTLHPAGFLRSVDGSGSGLVLPRLGTVPVMHRLVADDRLAVMLAKALLELDIAVCGETHHVLRPQGEEEEDFIHLGGESGS